jgi:hypothetical protein
VHWPRVGPLILLFSLCIGFPVMVLADTPAALIRFPNSYGGKIVFEAQQSVDCA